MRVAPRPSWRRLPAPRSWARSTAGGQLAASATNNPPGIPGGLRLSNCAELGELCGGQHLRLDIVPHDGAPVVTIDGKRDARI